jgi:hypothetical protein
MRTSSTTHKRSRADIESELALFRETLLEEAAKKIFAARHERAKLRKLEAEKSSQALTEVGAGARVGLLQHAKEHATPGFQFDELDLLFAEKWRLDVNASDIATSIAKRPLLDFFPNNVYMAATDDQSRLNEANTSAILHAQEKVLYAPSQKSTTQSTGDITLSLTDINGMSLLSLPPPTRESSRIKRKIEKARKQATLEANQLASAVIIARSLDQVDREELQNRLEAEMITAAIAASDAMEEEKKEVAISLDLAPPTADLSAEQYLQTRLYTEMTAAALASVDAMEEKKSTLALSQISGSSTDDLETAQRLQTRLDVEVISEALALG